MKKRKSEISAASSVRGQSGGGISFWKLNVQFSNRVLYSLIAIFILAIAAAGVYAYNAAGTGGNPAVAGHDASELGPGTFGEGNYTFPGASKVTIGAASTTAPDVKLYVPEGQVIFPGGYNPDNWPTHFNFSGDGKNYIRGTTIFADNGGSVGIGTTTPGTKLSVRVDGDGANAVLRLSSISTNWNVGNGPKLIFNGGTDDRPFGEIGTFLQNTGNGGNTYMTFSTRDSETVAERVRITSTGNVGIGAVNPDGKLSIINDAASTALGSGSIRLTTPAYPTSGWAFRIPDTQGTIDLSLDREYDGWKSPVMYFRRSDGYVGIGKTPGAMLDVNGNIKAGGNVEAAGNIVAGGGTIRINRISDNGCMNYGGLTTRDTCITRSCAEVGQSGYFYCNDNGCGARTPDVCRNTDTGLRVR